MREKHELENLMRSTMENLKDMIDVNTIIGDAIETKQGTYIVPVSKLSFGFASGGTDINSKSDTNSSSDRDYPFGGGSGAGVSVKPLAFIVINDNNVKLLPMDYDSTVDRVVDSVPQVLDKVQEFINKLSSSKNNSTENTDIPSESI